ncbi:MAG: HNH endonuclease [Verrucomicrobia bacterium]|nr:HNH endonuclease [Verrucomicrobiota bacterium]
MDSALRQLVRLRAGDRCEYCRLRQEDLPGCPFHLEHIRPRQHGGTGEPENLAWACFRCNRHKGPNLTGIDPETGQLVRLFDPRRHRWEDHFEFRGPVIAGSTPMGRATASLLTMNATERLEFRTVLLRTGGLLE